MIFISKLQVSIMSKQKDAESWMRAAGTFDLQCVGPQPKVPPLFNLSNRKLYNSLLPQV